MEISMNSTSISPKFRQIPHFRTRGSSLSGRFDAFPSNRYVSSTRISMPGVTLGTLCTLRCMPFGPTVRNSHQINGRHNTPPWLDPPIFRHPARVLYLSPIKSSSTHELQRCKSNLESLFCYDKSIPEEIIEKPVGLSLNRREIGTKPPCIDCQAKGATLCVTCSGSGLYVDSILESQGIIVKVRCLGCGGTGNIMCSECGGRGHAGIS